MTVGKEDFITNWKAQTLTLTDLLHIPILMNRPHQKMSSNQKGISMKEY